MQEFFEDICAAIQREIANQRHRKYSTVLRRSKSADDELEVMQALKAVTKHLGNLTNE